MEFEWNRKKFLETLVIRILLEQKKSKIFLNFSLLHDRNAQWTGILTKCSLYDLSIYCYINKNSPFQEVAQPKSEDQENIKITLEILCPNYNLLQTFQYVSNERWKSYKQIILFTKHLFFQEYNKYQQFGLTSYSHLNFHHFQLMHCNFVSIGDISKIVPNSSKILVRAKGISKKVHSPSQSCSYKKKFNGITKKQDIIKKKRNIQQKNKNNKLKKIKKKFGSDYSLTKFYSEKQKRIQQFVNKTKKSQERF